MASIIPTWTHSEHIAQAAERTATALRAARDGSPVRDRFVDAITEGNATAWERFAIEIREAGRAGL